MSGGSNAASDVPREVLEAACTGAALLKSHPTDCGASGIVEPDWSFYRWRLIVVFVLLCVSIGVLLLLVLPWALKPVALLLMLGVAWGIWLKFRGAETGAVARGPFLIARGSEIASVHHGWALGRDQVSAVCLCRTGSRITGAAVRSYRVLSVVVRDRDGVWYPVCATTGPQRFLVRCVKGFCKANGLTMEEIEPGHQSWPAGELLLRFLPSM